ncbi:hypothetical protein [Allohahella marinimesophila]|uniref:Uncharacterized protein n=1 Tax=Allohahella marinimesophila TaxID=1054972 RepID=A0ABP7NMB2_9GAMM
MADLHIEEFHKHCIAVLLQLYTVFPRKATVFVEDIIGPEEKDEFGLNSNLHQSCFGAMIWLADEGYLRYESTIRQEAVDQAVLTQHSFARLAKLVPERGQSVAHVLEQALRHESSTTLSRLCEDYLVHD